jgi:hypothetical protein
MREDAMACKKPPRACYGTEAPALAKTKAGAGLYPNVSWRTGKRKSGWEAGELLLRMADEYYVRNVT